MNIVEWFYVVMCVGIAWIVLTTPYLVEKLVKVIKEIRGKKREPLSDEAMAVMPNGVFVSNVYDAYEEGRKSVMSEQQAEAWIIVNKETGYRTQVSDLTPFLYHREIFEVIPLYTAPPVKSEQEPVGVVRTIGGYPDDSEHVVDWLCKYKDLKEGDRLYLAPPIPETTAEPVAWMVETHFNNEPIKEIHTVKPMERVYKYCIVTELYSAPLKPLTGIEISNGFKADDEATHPYSYWAGINFAEKHHGIGDGE